MILQHIILHKAVIKRKHSIDVNIEERITFCSVKHDFVTITGIEMSFFMRKANRATQKICIYKRDFFFVITRKLTPINEIFSRHYDIKIFLWMTLFVVRTLHMYSCFSMFFNYIHVNILIRMKR